MDTATLDPNTITNSLLQSLAIPLLLGTIASFILFGIWVAAKIISAVQMRHAYSDLKETRRLLTDLERRDRIRFTSERRRGLITEEDMPTNNQ